MKKVIYTALIVTNFILSSCMQTGSKQIELEQVDLDFFDFQFFPESEYYLFAFCYNSIFPDRKPSAISNEIDAASTVVVDAGFRGYDVIFDNSKLSEDRLRGAYHEPPDLTSAQILELHPKLTVLETNFMLEFHVYEPVHGIAKWTAIGTCLNRGMHQGRFVKILNVKNIVSTASDGSETVIIKDGEIKMFNDLYSDF
ncbi:MAG: hypothetical protein DRP64_12750 [Verrucomicrobia bacterium]|nr:MAG: hypothetical protein DRP64_12750 [Verrucomicrobiota bacterium]